MAEISFGANISSNEGLSQMLKQTLLSDSSAMGLIVSNLATIVWALVEGWELGIVLWVYWSQSVLIGILWFIKIFSLRDFSTEGVQLNNRPVDATSQTKSQIAFFFLFHYGFFHVIYAVFLGTDFSSGQIKGAAALCGFFAVSQAFSFFYNKKWRSSGKPNIGAMMFFPYARVIPMHLTIIFGGGILSLFGEAWAQKMTLVLFMLLKSVADLVMHFVERSNFGQKTETVKFRMDCSGL